LKWLRSEKEEKKHESKKVDPRDELEQKFSSKVSIDIQTAEAGRTASIDDYCDESIEDIWDDEYKIYTGGGRQWGTNFAYRTKQTRKLRPSSEDNFVFNTIQIQAANITSNIPEVSLDAQKKHQEHAKAVTYISRFNDERNKFYSMWKDIVLDFCSYGPAIATVEWDNEWMGGTGPQRWIGDVKISHINRRDFFPDPSIIDLENRLQDGRFQIIRYRKNVDTIKAMWPDTSKGVSTEVNDNDLQDEGLDSKNTDLFMYYHKGFPEYMPPERVKELRERARLEEEQGDSFKAEELYEMANGNVEGIHCAYYANDILLEYVPYKYDHGQYPIIFKTRYKDENSQWGFGEIRNTKIPQALHNKADEIEIEAMCLQGLGGAFVQAGSMNAKQKEFYLKNNAKGGMLIDVDNIQGIQPRQAVQVPQSIANYKEHKQRMIETVSSVTAIQQGMGVGANTPFKAIEALGARSDVRLQQAATKLRDFLVDLNKLRIQVFAQFYTEDRYFRIKGTDDKVVEGTFNRQQMFDSWAREVVTDPLTGQETEKLEYFVPEFDIKVDVINSKPNDRNYYSNIAFTMYDRQLMTGEDLWKTIDEGKFPHVEDILEHVETQNMVLGMVKKMEQVPPEFKEQLMALNDQMIQKILMQVGQQENQEKAKTPKPFEPNVDFSVNSIKKQADYQA